MCTTERSLYLGNNNKKFDQCIIVGDFNYKDINWNSLSTPSKNMEQKKDKFLETVKDTYLYQHVDKPTRGRGSDIPSLIMLIDLIFTREEGNVTNISYNSPYGRGDHCVLEFSFRCYHNPKSRKNKKTLYHKGNNEDIRVALKKVDWKKILEDKNTNVVTSNGKHSAA